MNLFLFHVFDERALSQVLHNPWLSVHILTAVLGQCMLAFSSIISLLYWIQERRLKEKELGPSVLPPLEVLERMHYRILIIGFVILSIGMVIGTIWASQIWPSSFFLEPRQLWSFGGWIMYGALLQIRYFTGMRGRKAAWFSVVALLMIIFNYIGIRGFTE